MCMDLANRFRPMEIAIVHMERRLEGGKSTWTFMLLWRLLYHQF